MSATDSTLPSDSDAHVGCPSVSGSALWMFFVARFREEYGFEPNPRDKSVREYFSWYGWGHAAREMGWAANKKIHPLMDCSDCGEFRGHGHVCKPNARAMTPSANKNENE